MNHCRSAINKIITKGDRIYMSYICIWAYMHINTLSIYTVHHFTYTIELYIYMYIKYYMYKYVFIKY